MTDIRDREIYRKNKINYTFRCSQETKEKLLIQAAREGRTANKILEDALEIYLFLKDRKITLNDIKKINSKTI